MDSILRLFRKLSLLFRRERFNDELAEEMAFHREQAEKQFVADGMSPKSAHYAAARQFGNAARLKERGHEAVEFRFETSLQDFRYALRQLRKNPGFACAAILILSLGICASVAIFAFVDAALIKPLPYPNPVRLTGVFESSPLFPRDNLSYPDYLDWKRLNKVFSSIDVYTATGYMLHTPAGTELVPAERVSDGFFRTLGIVPVLGRDFYDGEDLATTPRTVILTYGTWQKRFGGRKDAIGQTVTLSGVATTVIGVLPQSFQFAPRGSAEFWAPLHAEGSCDLRRSCHDLDAIARLRDGVSVQTATANMRVIAGELEKQYPDSNRGQGANVLLFSEVIVGDIRPLLRVLLGGAGLLLLIACVNVTSLLLVRSQSRKREIAVRGALGASPARLVRQFATEGLVLVAVGSALGLVSSEWTMRLLIKLIPAKMLAGMPYLGSLGLNFHVLVFTSVIALLAAILFSVIPIVRFPATEVREGLIEGGRGSAGTVWRRFASKLVVMELAIAMVLLVGAGLLGKSLYRLLHVELGFQPDHVATLAVFAPDFRYGKDEQVVELGRQAVRRISSLPGVKSVAIATLLPVSYNGNTDWIRFAGRPYNGAHNVVNERDVSAEYFTTLQAKLLRGRYFADAEDASKPRVAIINQVLAKKYFSGEDPIGQKIGDTELSRKSMKEIIGIVDDIKEGPLDSEVLPAVYYPFNQSPDTYFYLAVRTSQAEQSMLPTLDAAIHQIDPDIGTISEATMSDKINDSPSAYLHRSSAWLVGGFAAMALLLGVVGLYAVVAYSVSQRTREIGVRMALGAERSSIYQLILKEAGRLTILGIAFGILASLSGSALTRKLLFGVHTWDVSTLLGVATVLALAALLASYLPARRAASVNPIEALRTE